MENKPAQMYAQPIRLDIFPLIVMQPRGALDIHT